MLFLKELHILNEIMSERNNGFILLSVAVVLLVGIAFGKLAKMLRLPSVTGYLLAGIVFGPSVLGSFTAGGLRFGLSRELMDSMNIIYITAFSFICFSIGEEVKPKNITSLGKKALVISLFQSLGAVFLVGGALVLLAILSGEKAISLSAALILGALAAASAPTAKFMITRQYKTEGEITEMMVPVVVFDDVFGIITFSIIMSVIPAVSGEGVSVYSLLFAPLIEICSSVVLGIMLGILLGYITKIYKIQGARLVICIGFVLLAVAITQIVDEAKIYLTDSHEGHIRLSGLLVSIFMGGAFSFVNHEHGIRKRIDSWSYPLFVMFFVFAGAIVDFKNVIILKIVVAALVYIVFRFLGKYYGSLLASQTLRQSKNMSRYLGVTLLPQADVAIGMATVAATVLLSADAAVVEGVVFIAAIVFEIVGHIWIRLALKKAGEIHGDLESVTKMSRINHIHLKK